MDTQFRNLTVDLIKALNNLITVIDACDEDKLLALDNDPHPPSSLSVLADYARTVVAKAKKALND